MFNASFNNNFWKVLIKKILRSALDIPWADMQSNYSSFLLRVSQRLLKWLVTQKLIFIVGFPPSVQDFFLKLKYVPLNARVSGYLDLKFINLFLFALKIRKIYQKYAKSDKLINLKCKWPENRAFKSKCFKPKKNLVLMGETLQKI